MPKIISKIVKSLLPAKTRKTKPKTVDVIIRNFVKKIREFLSPAERIFKTSQIKNKMQAIAVTQKV